MYSGGSIVGKASTIGIEILPIPSIIFTQGQKSAKLGVVFNINRESLKVQPPAFVIQQEIRILKQTPCVATIALCPYQVWRSWIHAPLQKLCQL